jgi:ketosteroid isomerase-like protein
LVSSLSNAQELPIYQPAKDDPRIVAVLAARARLGVAMASFDIATVETLMAPDLVVNAPINRVANRTSVIARLRAHEISYEKTELKMDFIGVRGDSVVIMGEEIVSPNANAPHAGKIGRRRFTDIWKNADGNWQLAIRQATYFEIK